MQQLKQLHPIYTSLVKNSTEKRFWQWLKAHSPICDVFAGMIKLSTIDRLNAFISIESNWEFSSNFTDFKYLQWEKDFSPIYVTFIGISISVIDELKNAKLSISIKFESLSKLTFPRLWQFANA